MTPSECSNSANLCTQTCAREGCSNACRPDLAYNRPEPRRDNPQRPQERMVLLPVDGREHGVACVRPLQPPLQPRCTGRRPAGLRDMGHCGVEAQAGLNEKSPGKQNSLRTRCTINMQRRTVYVFPFRRLVV